MFKLHLICHVGEIVVYGFSRGSVIVTMMEYISWRDCASLSRVRLTPRSNLAGDHSEVTLLVLVRYLRFGSLWRRSLSIYEIYLGQLP